MGNEGKMKKGLSSGSKRERGEEDIGEHEEKRSKAEEHKMELDEIEKI